MQWSSGSFFFSFSLMMFDQLGSLIIEKHVYNSLSWGCICPLFFPRKILFVGLVVKKGFILFYFLEYRDGIQIVVQLQEMQSLWTKPRRNFRPFNTPILVLTLLNSKILSFIYLFIYDVCNLQYIIRDKILFFFIMMGNYGIHETLFSFVFLLLCTSSVWCQQEAPVRCRSLW